MRPAAGFRLQVSKLINAAAAQDFLCVVLSTISKTLVEMQQYIICLFRKEVCLDGNKTSGYLKKLDVHLDAHDDRNISLCVDIGSLITEQN